MRRLSDFPLWLGHVGDARDLRAVLSAGVLALVDLAVNEPPLTPTRELVYCRFPIVDGEENPPWLLRLAVDATANLIRSETPTLLFCSHGMSRTPVIAGAAIATVRGLSLADGLALAVNGGRSDVTPGLFEAVRQAIR